MRQFESECNLTKAQDTQIIIAINKKIREYTAGNTEVCIPLGSPNLTARRDGCYNVAMNFRIGNKRTILEFTI